MKVSLNATVQQSQRFSTSSVGAVPAAVATAEAAAFQEARGQDEKAGGRVEIAVLAVRHSFGMDGGDARVINGV